MLRNVYLEGEMGERFLPHLQLQFSKPQEVLQALDANFPDFRSYLLEKHEEGVNFEIDIAGKEIEEPAELLLEIKEGDITITPIPAGSKSGPLKVLAAIALITVVMMNPALFVTATGAQTAGAMAATGVINPGTMALLQAGASLNMLGLATLGVATNLALNGLNQMMAPDPSTDSDQEESYLFNGAEQNIVSGDPVPILYGRLRVPGQPISFEIAGGSTSSYGSYSDSNGNYYSDGNSTEGDTSTTNPNCLEEGTMIATPSGLQPIQNLAVGDYVISADGAENQILSLDAFENEKVFTVNGIITMTAAHLLLTPEGWAAIDAEEALLAQEPGISVQDLYPGMSLVLEDGQLSEVTSIELEEDLATVYTMKLDGDHTYIANGIITHNK